MPGGVNREHSSGHWRMAFGNKPKLISLVSRSCRQPFRHQYRPARFLIVDESTTGRLRCWSARRYRRARDLLLQLGLIKRVQRDDKGRFKAEQYTLGERRLISR